MFSAFLHERLDLSDHEECAEQKVHNLECQHEVPFASDVPEETEGEDAGIRSKTSGWELFKEQRDNTKQVGVCVVNGKLREDSSCVAVQPVA